MRRLPGPASRTSLSLVAWVALGTGLAHAAADHVLISEFAVRPTDGEFIEIYNPTSSFVDLSRYYLSDFVLGNGGDDTPESNYYHLVDGVLNPDPAFPNDFLARFPDGTAIAPGESIVIALHDDEAFTSVWSSGGDVVVPDFELVNDGTIDGVPALIDGGLETLGMPLIQSAAGLSNSREVIVLFHWDGQSDLVQDVDIVQWSNAGPDFFTVGPNKTGVMVDGPDADSVATPYQPDTPKQGQSLAFPGPHGFDLTITRIDFSEGNETLTGGNGLTLHDETSEDLANTWMGDTEHSIGSPGPFGPPALVSAAAVAANAVEVRFSRALDMASAEETANFTMLRVQSPEGEITDLPVQLVSAQLVSAEVVRLETEPLIPQAVYELQARGILTEDGSAVLVAGSRVFIRGFNPGPGIELDVPKRPFVPHLDRSMTIRYVAPQGENILLRLFDMEGRELFVMADELAPAGGVRNIRWDGRDHLRQRVPAGVYILHLEIPGAGDETTAPIIVAAPPEGVLR